MEDKKETSRQNNQSKGFRTGDVVSISLAHLAHDIYTSFLAPILPLIVAKLGISLSMAGMLSVIQKIPSLFNPLVGIIADNFKVRYFVIFAPAITTVSMSLIGLAPNYFMLAVLLFITGISSTLFHVPSPVMIRHVSGNKLGMGMSFFMVGGELARTLGPLIIVAAVTQWGLEGSYKLIPFGLTASAILFFKLRKIDLREDFHKTRTKVSYASTYKNFSSTFMILGLIIFFRGAMKSALTLYLSVYLTSKGNSLWFSGIALSVIQFAGVIGTLTAGTLSDKVGRRTAMLVIAVASPLLMWVFLHSQGIYTFPILIVTGFFLVAPGPVMLAIVQEIDTEHRAFVNGIYMTISFALSSLMLLLVGFLSDHFGMDLTYQISSFTALLAIPFAMMLPKKKTG
ncbi:MAG: MFS transporter [Spirochaetes bacterium]|nr:MAG: MFS transporter [Spirochaetota bacterium]